MGLSVEAVEALVREVAESAAGVIKPGGDGLVARIRLREIAGGGAGEPEGSEAGPDRAATAHAPDPAPSTHPAPGDTDDLRAAATKLNEVADGLDKIAGGGVSHGEPGQAAEAGPPPAPSTFADRLHDELLDAQMASASTPEEALAGAMADGWDAEWLELDVTLFSEAVLDSLRSAGWDITRTDGPSPEDTASDAGSDRIHVASDGTRWVETGERRVPREGERWLGAEASILKRVVLSAETGSVVTQGVRRILRPVDPAPDSSSPEDTASDAESGRIHVDPDGKRWRVIDRRVPKRGEWYIPEWSKVALRAQSHHEHPYDIVVPAADPDDSPVMADNPPDSPVSGEDDRMLSDETLAAYAGGHLWGMVPGDAQVAAKELLAWREIEVRRSSFNDGWWLGFLGTLVVRSAVSPAVAAVLDAAADRQEGETTDG